MAIKLGDKTKQVLETATQNMYAALQSDDENVQKEAFQAYSVALAESMQEIENHADQQNEDARSDQNIMY